MRNLVLAVHGSAVPEAGAAVERLADAVRRLTGAPVAVGHLDHQKPSLPYVLADRPGAVVVPLLLGDGYHRTVDIPAVARHFDCAVTRGLSGEHAVALALHDRLRAAERAAGGPADAVVVAGAGSSRPGGNDGTLTAVRQLATLLPVPVTVAYCSASTPTPAEAVARLHAQGFRRVAVAAHLLAPGRFTRALAEVPETWAVGEPLAGHPRLAGLVVARYAGACVAEQQPSPYGATRPVPRGIPQDAPTALLSWDA
ncbi:sirohydrochlorin chelatase [Streptomyces sp. WAC01280]|uniref:sirohydrochlorin chelatase n=1 Tax=Streptomyces sp. WAC01280 TaxID=2487424 RepID=UPI000F770683|nr:CbiX/SirB N-terminal domain-containing protein [Streptomyces sp. WAC01280]RSS51332.1 sirohydrochlorin chelatase [Streptomyces sp. WAC01280]